MIRINLLRERRAKKVPKGEQTLLVGVGVVLVVAAGVFLFLHLPLANSIDDLNDENAKLQRHIKKLNEDTKEFDAVQAQLNAAREQEESIARLNNARAVPAWMLWELSEIMTKGDHHPTMSPDMMKLMKDDANRRWTPGWDPKRIWISSIDEHDGLITIVGGAQATTDVTQLALRLQASVFFFDVLPASQGAAVDQASHLNYYTYTITGKVRY